MVKNYRNVEKKAVKLEPKVNLFRDLFKTTLVEGWLNMLRFRKLCRSEYLQQYLDIVDCKSNKLLSTIKITNEFTNPSKMLTRLPRISNMQSQLGLILDQS